MNNQFSVFVKRYLIAAIIAIFGIVMIFIGMNSNQDSLFMMAAINLLIGGILAILFSAGILGRNVVLGIGIVCIGISIYFMAMSVKSVERTQQHQIDYAKSDELMRYSLTQIRDIQRAYRVKNGVYASNF